jgi:hypothetical protein
MNVFDRPKRPKRSLAEPVTLPRPVAATAPAAERPLGDVLMRAVTDYLPQRPNRAPWVQPSGEPVEVAATGNVLSVPLVIADRVNLHGLDGAPMWRDDLEPSDWTPAGWGVIPPAA